MPTHSTSRLVNSNAPIHVERSEDVQRTVHRLKALAVNGLAPMFDPERQLFCYGLKRTERGLVREGISKRYTIMALLGLHRLEESGATSPIRIQPVLEGLLTNTDWIDNIGDLGLLLWLCAQAAPERLAEVERRLEVRSALARFRDVRQGRTMELAWFLTGLSYRSLACPEKLPDLRDLAVETYRLLRKNQGERGIFGHVARNGSMAGMVRGGIGSFADQVYPIYAMTKFSQAYGDDKAIESALDCALTLCEAQGSLGQWWWHYDSSNGEVAEKFPVFSVHQHGMGPMTLFMLGKAIQSDFGPWIYKGLRWIDDNELGFDMQDKSANVVWRCIERTAPRRYWNAAINLITEREHRESRDGLRILFECRPYELGWLLYGLAHLNEE
jgi:hypothetical protein